jgi:hypothetical protein
LFTLVDTTVRITSPTRADLTIEFTNRYDQLNPEQRQTITGIALVGRTGIGEVLLPAGATTLMAESLRRNIRYCFELR